LVFVLLDRLFEIILKVVKPDHTVVITKTKVWGLVDELLDLAECILIVSIVFEPFSIKIGIFIWLVNIS
jgi:hypothetical protein